MMKNIYQILQELLQKNSNYVSNEQKILKTKIIDDAINMNINLLELLLSNDKIKSEFFIPVGKTLVFDKQKFIWFLESKEFLPDSFTKYKNSIGLYDLNMNSIKKNNDVVLNFPFKDCLIGGGKTKMNKKEMKYYLMK